MRCSQTQARLRSWWAALSVGVCLPMSAVAASAPAAPTTAPTTRPVENTASGGAPTSDDLTKLSLEDLMNVEVTSVAKQPQKAAESPAAVTVIGQDDIARSGLQTVPDLLRLSPGMDVAQLNANTWAIGARGFNDIYSNKLLVLNDGRSVYNPTFSGVYWDLQQPLLADLDRIEVIRGPGATLYGSNAVDGVVNITSKSARDTQGWYVDGLGGNEDQSAAVRFGGQLDDKTYFRIYDQYRKTDDFLTPTGNDGRDGWQSDSAGFRLDRYATSEDTFTLQADGVTNRDGQTIQVPAFRPPYQAYDNTSSNADQADVQGRWTHVISDTADFTLQTYYDHEDHTAQLLPTTTDTGDLNLRNRFALGERQELVWGAEYRFWQSYLGSSPLADAPDHTRDDYIASGFVQDDFTIVRDRLHLLAGTELEETSLGGFDVQPSGQLLWTPNDRNTVWGSVARAVRTPSTWERSTFIATPPTAVPGSPLPVQYAATGDASFGDESELSYQIGYRVKPWTNVSFDANASYNHYDDLRSFGESAPHVVLAPSPHLQISGPLGNSLGADTYSFELAANWQVTPTWRLAASYSLLEPHAFERGTATPSDAEIVGLIDGGSPENQAQIHSYWDVTKTLSLNASVYYVDRLVNEGVPAYVRTDLNVVWRPQKNLDVTFGVQNLVDNQHPEFNRTAATYTAATEVPRTFYGAISYHF